MWAWPCPNSQLPSAFPHYQEIERQPHDHERQTHAPTELRADDPTKTQDHRNDETTGSRRKDKAEPEKVGETAI